MLRKKEKDIPEKEGENRTDQSVYADLFDIVDEMDFDRIAGVDGIDDEIELMRYQIRKVMEGATNPNLKLIIQATNAIERMVRTRYRITSEQSKSIREMVKGVIREVALPMGMSIFNRVVGD